MNNWWSGLNVREQAIVSVAGLIGLIIIIDSLIIQPFSLKYEQLDEKIEQAIDDLSWMKQAVFRLPGDGNLTKRINSGKVVSFIDQHITRQGLKKNMQQMTPVEDHSARLKLSEIEFSKLLKFFTAIEGSVIIQEVRLLPTDEVGVVNVSLLISNGSGAK